MLQKHCGQSDNIYGTKTHCKIVFCWLMGEWEIKILKPLSRHSSKCICDPSREKGPYRNCKKYRSGQPAQSAQTDHGRNFSLLADFCVLSDNST